MLDLRLLVRRGGPPEAAAPPELTAVAPTGMPVGATVHRPITLGAPPMREPFADASLHMLRRMEQRALAPDQVAYVRAHGTSLRRTGVEFVVLLDRDVPAEDRRNDRYARLGGTILLESDDGVAITAYRRRDPLRHVRKKMEYRLRTTGG